MAKRMKRWRMPVSDAPVIAKSTTDPREQLVVEVFVRDLVASLAFYQRLGFDLIRQHDGFAELGWEGNLFFLDQRGDLPPNDGAVRANVRIMVGDVDEYWNIVERLGLPVVASIADRDYGLRDFTIADPDGFGLRFASRLKESAPANPTD